LFALAGSHSNKIEQLQSKCHLDVTFDRTDVRAEHHLQLGRILHTDWFPDPLVLHVSTTPHQPATVTTHTERTTERVCGVVPLPRLEQSARLFAV
jgi:hypothetical protein